MISKSGVGFPTPLFLERANNMHKDEIIYLSTREILKLYREKKLSPVEMLNAQIKQTEYYNDKVNCIVQEHFDEAMRAAKESEQLYMDGNPRPLEGITCAIKDDAQVKGWRHSWGSLLMKDVEPAAYDAPLVDMLRQTGVLMHIQTTAPEFFLAGVTWSHLWGITRNPWNMQYTPGGSSGGSGAALAAGFTTLAIGSDMGGSIRIPAAMCGLYACKPPFGRVPTSEVAYETFGPMGRTFDDMNLLQQHISGPHPFSHSSLRPKLDYPESYGDVKGWKIAVDTLSEYGAEVDGSVSRSMQEAIEKLKSLGCEVEVMDLGFRHEDFETMIAGLMSTEMGLLAVIAYEDFDSLTPYVQDFLKSYGDKMGPKYAVAAAELLMRYNQRVQQKVFMQGFQAIVMPTMLTPYVEADWFATPEKAFVKVNGKQVESRMGFFTTWMWNLLGRHPVVNVPNGMTNDTIPSGMQIISNTFEDVHAFQLAQAWTKVAPDFYKMVWPDFRSAAQ
jgi:amidase